jgi:hypothetical protein
MYAMFISARWRTWMPKDKVKQPTLRDKRAGNPLKTAQVLGPMGVMMGLPAQVRLSAREQQPRPPVIAVGKKRGRGR